MRRSTRVLALVAVIALAGAACTSGEGTPDEGKQGGSVNAYLSEPDTLDPALATTTTASEVLGAVFDPLVRYDPVTFEIEFTGAAESVEVNDDATMLTFQLREGATFHDGSDVTAEDFVRALTRAALKDTASVIAYHLSGIKGFDDAQSGKSDELPGVHEGDDPLELVIELEETNAEFFIRTGHSIFSPVPEAAVEDPEGFAEMPIGNGPYQMVGPWQRNVSITLEKFADYTGEEAGFLDEINFKIFAEIETAYLEFEAGTIDTTDVPPEQFEAAAANYGDGYVDISVVIAGFLMLDNTGPPTDNATFRQALSLAIDRESIVGAVFAGTREAASSFIPPGNAGYRQGVCIYCVFDADLAKQKLEESGETATEITVSYNSGGGHEEWIQAVAANIEENLGIKVNVDPGPEDFGDYLEIIRGKNRPEMSRYGWAQDYPTPDNWLNALLYSTAGDNYGEYNNPDFDAKIDEAQRTIDDAARLALYNEAEDIVIEDMPLLPIYYYSASKVYNSDKIATFVLNGQYGDPSWRHISLT